ncbi:MAG: APC family permease [Actinobacteria bacterium]|nr:APC family permease [Actinomycetota bacterium]
MAAEIPTPEGVFTRASSGLVRQVRTDDVFWFGWQTIALSYIVFTILAWGAYPGASMELASLLAMIGGIAIASCYALLATVYPRSGAEYVFLSRSLNPAAGFALSFSFSFWQMFYIGINGAFLSLFSISPVLAGIGVQAKSQALLDLANWFAGKWGIFICGSAMVLLMGYLHYRGAGVYFRWQRWASYVSVVSLLATIVVLILAASGALDFQANLDELAGAGTYSSVVVAGGPAPAFSLGQTWSFVLWPAFSLWFAITAVSFSGEVKNVQRGHLLGMVGSVVAMGIAFIVLMALYRGAFGSDFILSASANGLPLEAPPFVPFFTAIAGGNVLLTIVMSLWVLVIAVWVGGTAFVYPSRTLLAWSIDGMAPERLGDVNERYHSPHWALLVCVAVAEVTLYLFAFTTLLGFVSGFLGLALNFLVVSVWSILFPYVRRETFESSPIALRVGGVPVLTILGVVATVFVIPMLYRLGVDRTFSLNLAFVYWGAIIAVAGGFVWYYGWRAYQKSRGVDLDRRYREIPIE